MSRSHSTANLAEIAKDHLHEVVLVKLDFDTPVYVHTGIGTITYDGNDYLGVGDLGFIGAARESASLGPLPITMTLTGISSDHITEALDSGNYRDAITCYVGYRQDDGTLVSDPYVVYSGWYEYALISQGQENSVTITVQHDLSVLSESDGSRFNDEDQNERYATDIFFKHITLQPTVKLVWGGGSVTTGLATGIPRWKEPKNFGENEG